MTEQEEKTYNALLNDIFKNTSMIDYHATKKAESIKLFHTFCKALKMKNSINKQFKKEINNIECPRFTQFDSCILDNGLNCTEKPCIILLS